MPPSPRLFPTLGCALLPALAEVSPVPIETRGDELADRPVVLEVVELGTWDAQHGDWLGYSVATSREWLLAGAPGDDLAGGDSGSVAVFRLTSGTPEQVDLLAPDDGHRAMYFGLSLAVDGDCCAIGAPWDDERGPRSGSVYVYRWNGESWRQEAKLRASDGAAEDRFGYSVAIDGEHLAIGARWDDDRGENSGSVYLFRRSDGRWLQEAKLTPEVGGGAGDQFGVAVALSEGRLAVGAYADPHAGLQSGTVHLYRRDDSSWSFERRLEASDAAEGDGFGVCLDLGSSTCVVGAPWKAGPDGETGTVYVFGVRGGEWLERQRLTPHQAIPGGHFGRSLSLSGDRLLIGAPFGGADPEHSGAAFFFRRFDDRWNLVGPLPRTRAESGDGYGWAVNLQGERITVGARGLDAAGTGADQGHLLTYTPRRKR